MTTERQKTYELIIKRKQVRIELLRYLYDNTKLNDTNNFINLDKIVNSFKEKVTKEAQQFYTRDEIFQNLEYMHRVCLVHRDPQTCSGEPSYQIFDSGISFFEEKYNAQCWNNDFIEDKEASREFIQK
jgi:hypothetical protein